MNFDTIIPYLESSDENEKILTDFFNDEEVKSYLINKWDSYKKDSPKSNDKEIITPEQEIEKENDENLVPLVPSEENKTKSFIDDFFFKTRLKSIENKLSKHHIQLPNGKVNQEYSILFDTYNLGLSEFHQFQFSGLETIGLRYNDTTNTIEGTPTISGDFKITLSCCLDIDNKQYSFTKKVPLIINPDPRSLWNNIPTPEDIEYYKPDSDYKYVQVEKTKGFLGLGSIKRKDLVAASQRGRSHGHEGKARDDDFSITYNTESEWYLALVADGAGSAPFARKGSEIACATASDVCNFELANNKDIDNLIKGFQKDNSDDNRKKLGDALYNMIGAAVFKAYKNIEQEAADNNSQIKDYATTILIAVTKKYKFGWFVASFWIGDGGIGLYNKETSYIKIMGDPDGGEFAGQTRFLTMGEVMQPSEIYKRLRFEIIEDFTALILMTDGVTDPKFETDSNLQKIEKWNKLWSDLTSSVDLTDNNPDAAKQLLKWLDFWSPGNHDDRTIAMIY